MSGFSTIPLHNYGLTPVHIVVCQRGGVSIEPPGLRAVTRHGVRDPYMFNMAILTITTYKKFKKETGRIFDPF